MTRAWLIPGVESYPAEREALNGLAVAQARAYRVASRATTAPLVQIIVANAGAEGRRAPELLADLTRLVQLDATSDATIVGVVVAMDSRSTTQEVMRGLDKLGLIVMTATGAADGLGAGLERYLQLQPPNREQAGLVHRYVTEILGRRRLTNYYTYGQEAVDGADDMYVNTLRDGLAARFTGATPDGPAYTAIRWHAGVDLRDHCADPFDDGVVFFGGRYTNFADFVHHLDQACDGHQPVLMAAGNTSRYLISDDRHNDAPEGFPLIVGANGTALNSCAPDRVSAAYREFRSYVMQVLKRCLDATDRQPLGVRVGLTYDLVTILIQAAEAVAATPQPPPVRLHAVAIHDRIRWTNDRGGFRGAAGWIHFDAGGVVDSGGESLLCVRDIRRVYTEGHTPVEIARTGNGHDPPVRMRWCSGL